ncbi:MAG: helix-turn-helix domain-containing protein [Candidatus Micrarchaeia archaeon]|jgi:sugar-specific transcriptional regulator TrmB
MEADLLLQAGLTEGESKVYLALLELGASTTGPIVEKSGVSRSIIYQLLERLAQKGLVSHIVKDKTKHFQAADPSRIRDFLEEEERKFSENRKNVEALLPKLYAMRAGAKQSEATIYLGFKGMMTAHEHTYQVLKPGEEYFYLGIPHDQPDYVHAYWKRDHRRREKAGIKCRLLFDRRTPIEVLRNRNSFRGCEARYMPSGIETPSSIVGFKNVTLIGFATDYAISVEIVDKKIADSFRAYFEEFWKRTRPVDKEKKEGGGKKDSGKPVFDSEDYSSSEM